MGTTAQKLQKLSDTKTAIGEVITDNGGTLPATFAGYPAELQARVDAAQDAGWQDFVNKRAQRSDLDTLTITVNVVQNYSFYWFDEVAVEGQYVYVINDYAFYHNARLQRVNFPRANTIKNNAFSNCGKLAEASFPNVQTIGSNAFAYTALTTASFPKVTSIGAYAFISCTALTTASFPNVTSIGQQAFNGDISLVSITCPKVTSIGLDAFDGTHIAELHLPELTGLTSRVLYGAVELTTLDIPLCATLTTPFGTSTPNTYTTFPNLTALSLPSITTISARTFGYSSTRSYVPNLADLYIPNKTIEEVKAMANYASWNLPTTCTIHASDGDFVYRS